MTSPFAPGAMAAVPGPARRPFRLTEPKRARYLFEEAPIGIALLDLGGVVVEANGAFARAFGRALPSFLGRPLEEAVSREDRDDLRGQLSKLVMGTAHMAQLADVRLASSDHGERRLSLFARRVDELGEPLGFVVHVLERADRHLVDGRAQHAQRLEAIGQLAGGIAHDFNNLLTATLGFCDLLLSRLPPGDPAHDDVLQIRANAQRGGALVRQLLAFSRRQTVAPARIEVGTALAELTKMLGRLLGPAIQLRVESQGEGFVDVDPGQFDQVIINLAVNARDAMPEGGTLTIRSLPLTLSRPTQRGDEVVPPGAYVLIEVADTGVGIAKEILGNIFEPFFSTKAPGAGSGLGLATVYGIVRQSNGYIAVDSAPGEGAVFSIYLPAAPRGESGASPAYAGVMPAPLPRRPATILLVEDEASIRLLASRALKREGYEVIEADDGEAALAWLAAGRPIDLLLSDIMMPGLDGRHLARLARERQPRLRVMLMSGYADADLGVETEGAGFLQKPFSIGELSRAVSEALAA